MIARKKLWDWTKEWESVGDFDYHIRSLWYKAEAEDASAISAWATEMNHKLARGKEILIIVRDIAALQLPAERGEAEDLWRQAFEILLQVYRGLALIEVWLDLTKTRDLL